MHFDIITVIGLIGGAFYLASHYMRAMVPLLRLPESSRTGFRIKDYSVSFTGLCPDCAKKKS